MMRVGNSRGFTILEVIIFLTVSSALMIGAMAMISGQFAKTEFRQAVGGTQSLVDDVANNVSTGYYQGPGLNSNCINFGGTPALWSGTAERGKNTTCMVVGQVIRFDAEDSMTTYPVIGFRSRGVGQLTDNLSNNSTGAVATLLNAAGYKSVEAFPSGLRLRSATYVDSSGTRVPVRGVAFVSTIGILQSNSNAPGSLTVDVVPLTGIRDAVNETSFENSTNATLRTAGLPNKNPSSGVLVCLDSGGTNQHIRLRIGEEASLFTRVEFQNGPSSADSECQP